MGVGGVISGQQNTLSESANLNRNFKFNKISPAGHRKHFCGIHPLD